MLSRVALSISCLLIAAPLTSAHSQYLPFRLVHPGKSIKVVFIFSIEPDCRSRGPAVLTLAVPPSGGKITTRNASDYPNLPQRDSSFACNRRRVPGTQVFYQADPGFAGNDTFTVQGQFPNGYVVNYKYNILVQ